MKPSSLMFIFNTLCLHSPYIYFICINNNRPMSINEVTFGKLKAPLKVGGGGGGKGRFTPQPTSKVCNFVHLDTELYVKLME